VRQTAAAPSFHDERRGGVPRGGVPRTLNALVGGREQYGETFSSYCAEKARARVQRSALGSAIDRQVLAFCLSEIERREGEGWLYAPLAKKWVAEQLGLVPKTVGHAMIRLHRRGELVWDGHVTSRKRIRLWREGDGVPQAWPPAKADVVVPDNAPIAERPRPMLRPARTDELLGRALGAARIGCRDREAFRLGCQLRDLGRSYELAEAVMEAYVMGVPQSEHRPYTVREAMAALRSAYSRPARAPFLGPDSPGASAMEEFR
jgi:hypothetical protein